MRLFGGFHRAATYSAGPNSDERESKVDACLVEMSSTGSTLYKFLLLYLCKIKCYLHRPALTAAIRTHQPGSETVKLYQHM